MKKFLLKLFFFSLPIVAFVGFSAYQILIRPIDANTFRSWEALSVYEKTPILSGPFYPNVHLTKIEFGDLSGLTHNPVPKNVEWYTDQYGYRGKNIKGKYNIVIIGDSAIAGSGLTQSDMFSEIIANKLNISVYAYAPKNFNEFLREKKI